MKKHQILKAMLSAKKRSPSVALGTVSEDDFEDGVSAVSLDGTVGNFRPISLHVGGAALTGASPTPDAPIAITELGDPMIDRIGRGFFSLMAENTEDFYYSTNGLSEEEDAVIALDLGEDYDGTVWIGAWGMSFKQTLSGHSGDRLLFSLPAKSVPAGKISLTASQDGVFRLSLCGVNELEKGYSLTVLSCGESKNSMTCTTILLPTPLYALPSGQKSELHLESGQVLLGVEAVPLRCDTQLRLRSETASAACPAFEIPVFARARGEGKILCTHGTVQGYAGNVLSGEREGLSLLPDRSDQLVLALSRERLSGDVVSLAAERLDDATSGSPESPAPYTFYPYGEYDHWIDGLDGELLYLWLAEPLRCIGTYVDRLYFDRRRRLALRETRIGELTLMGAERMTFRQKNGYTRVTVPHLGGQLSSPSRDVPQLCTHGIVSADAVFHSPELVTGLACYLDDDGLEIVLEGGQPYAASEADFRDFLRRCFDVENPIRCYYPLAAPRFETIELEVLEDDASELEGSAMLSAQMPNLNDAETLSSLARLWFEGQWPRPRVLYPLAEPYFAPILGMTGELRMAEGKTSVSVVGDVKPISLSLVACVYPGGATPSTVDAAGSETFEVPQKGTE